MKRSHIAIHSRVPAVIQAQVLAMAATLIRSRGIGPVRSTNRPFVQPHREIADS